MNFEQLNELEWDQAEAEWLEQVSLLPYLRKISRKEKAAEDAQANEGEAASDA